MRKQVSRLVFMFPLAILLAGLVYCGWFIKSTFFFDNCVIAGVTPLEIRATYDESSQQLFIATSNKEFYSINPQTGQERWKMLLSDTFQVTSDALLGTTTSSRGEQLALIQKNGLVRWKFPTQSSAEKTFIEQFFLSKEVVYVIVQDSFSGGRTETRLEALRLSDGQSIWKRNVGQVSSRVIGIDGDRLLLIAGGSIHAKDDSLTYLAALTIADGQTVWGTEIERSDSGNWEVELGYEHQHQLRIHARDGQASLSESEHRVYLKGKKHVASFSTADGVKLWEVKIESRWWAMKMGPEHTALIMQEGKITALQGDTGASRWTLAVDISDTNYGYDALIATITTSDRLYLAFSRSSAGSSGKLIAIQTTEGQQIWIKPFRGWSSLLLAKETLYHGSSKSTFKALKLESGEQIWEREDNFEPLYASQEQVYAMTRSEGNYCNYNNTRAIFDYSIASFSSTKGEQLWSFQKKVVG